MSAFTPGPWEVNRSEDEPLYVFQGEGERPVICDLLDNFGNEEQEANGFLISAAPEMYRALKEILARHSTTLWSLPSELEELVQEALNKAEGFEP